jgi:hypothetical protein
MAFTLIATNYGNEIMKATSDNTNNNSHQVPVYCRKTGTLLYTITKSELLYSPKILLSQHHVFSLGIRQLHEIASVYVDNAQLVTLLASPAHEAEIRAIILHALELVGIGTFERPTYIPKASIIESWELLVAFLYFYRSINNKQREYVKEHSPKVMIRANGDNGNQLLNLQALLENSTPAFKRIVDNNDAAQKLALEQLIKAEIDSQNREKRLELLVKAYSYNERITPEQHDLSIFFTHCHNADTAAKVKQLIRAQNDYHVSLSDLVQLHSLLMHETESASTDTLYSFVIIESYVAYLINRNGNIIESYGAELELVRIQRKIADKEFNITILRGLSGEGNDNQHKPVDITILSRGFVDKEQTQAKVELPKVQQSALVAKARGNAALEAIKALAARSKPTMVTSTATAPATPNVPPSTPTTPTTPTKPLASIDRLRELIAAKNAQKGGK